MKETNATREIKFRAFVKGKMLYGIYPGQCVSADLLESGQPGAFDLEQTEKIMQFTGLKDKNGKDIYEGDWITVCNFNYRHSDLTLDREKSIEMNLRKGVIEWMPYNCCFMAMERHLQRKVFDQWNNAIELRPSEEDNYELEIIGNIYENPELLK